MGMPRNCLLILFMLQRGTTNMEDKKVKFGLSSIVLLGINGIIGTGIFLLPNRAYAQLGHPAV